MDQVTAAAASPPRAPRLTENRLVDLDVVVELLDENIEHLSESVAYWADQKPATPTTQGLRDRLQLRLERLQRGREYLSGLLVAERAQRAARTEVAPS